MLVAVCQGLSLSSIKGYCSMLSAVFSFHLPSLSSHPVLRDLLRPFRLSSAERVLRPPAWDLAVILRFLIFSAFEPLSQAPLRALSHPVSAGPRYGQTSLGVTGSVICGYLCRPFLCSSVCGQVGVAHPFHPSLLPGEVLVRFCGQSR